MGIFAGPEVIEEGLVLALDAANLKGYDKYENLTRYSSEHTNSYWASPPNGGVSNLPTITLEGSNILGNYYRWTKTSSLWTTGFFGSHFPGGSDICTISFNIKWGGGVTSLVWRGYHNLTGTCTNTITIDSSSGVDIGDGWKKVSMTFVPTNACNRWFISINGDGYWLMQNIQSELGSSVTDYYATTSTTKTRGTTWTDLSLGSGNNGTLVNGPTYNSSNRGSIVFDGVDDYITVSNVQPNTNNFTISVWVYKFNNTSNDYIWDFGSNGGTLSAGTSVSGYGFRYYNGTLGTSSNMYTQGTIPDINKWYNVSITRNSGTSTMYVNGSLITSSSGDTHNISSTTLYIGRYGGGTGYEHHGYISNFNIYNRALTATEIQKNFNAQRGRFGI